MKMLYTGEGVGRWGEVVGWILVYEIPVYAHPLFLSELLCELVGFILQNQKQKKSGGGHWEDVTGGLLAERKDVGLTTSFIQF